MSGNKQAYIIPGSIVMEKIKQKKIMTIKRIQSDSSACMPVSPSLLFLAGYQGSPPD